MTSKVLHQIPLGLMEWIPVATLPQGKCFVSMYMGTAGVCLKTFFFTHFTPYTTY